MQADDRVACYLFGLLNRANHAVGDERVHGWVRPGRPVVGNHETWGIANRAAVSPTAVALVLIERLATHHDGPTRTVLSYTDDVRRRFSSTKLQIKAPPSSDARTGGSSSAQPTDLSRQCSFSTFRRTNRVGIFCRIRLRGVAHKDAFTLPSIDDRICRMS